VANVSGGSYIGLLERRKPVPSALGVEELAVALARTMWSLPKDVE
jgi:hypothetical protein